MDNSDIILDSISDGVFTVDSEWHITSFNSAAEYITGIARSDAKGRFCSEVFRSSMCEDGCPLRETLKTGKPVINKTGFIIDADGSRIPISVSTAVLRNSEGEVIGGVETFRDLSEIEALRKELTGSFSIGDIVSHSPAMRNVSDMATAVAGSPSTVLILGETGTGKELLARAIHSMGRGESRPFVAVNCGALPDSLLESELFGYKKGAFTGAASDKPGRFALAGDGTLFLDEIGEISPALQIRLLRVLQEHTYEPLGSTVTETTEARIIAATNRDLAALVKEGKFRLDLYYRINVVSIELPPLRKRKEDIPLLADHFVRKFNFLQKRDIEGFTPESYSIMIAWDWPGNVRELENVTERAFVLSKGRWITPEQLPDEITGADNYLRRGNIPDDTGNMEGAKKTAEKKIIIDALEKSGFNRQKASDLLGIHKTTLFRKIKELDIIIPHGKKDRGV